VIDIDNASFDLLKPKLGRWPWTRRVWAMILNHVSAGKPRAIAFDAVYGGVESQEVDQEFATAIESAGDVILGFSLNQAEVERIDDGDGAQIAVLAPEAIRTTTAGPKDRTLNVPEAMLAQAAAGLGCITAAPDEDGKLRAAPITCAYGDSLYASLSVRTVLMLEPGRWTVPVTGGITRDGKAVALDREGRLLLRYHGLTYERIPLWYVGCSIAPDDCEPGVPKYPPEYFKDKIVLLGASAATIFDNYPTPLARVTPGVLVHAAAIDNLLHGNSMRLAPRWALPLLVLVLAFAAAGALLRFEAAIPGGAAIVVLLAIFMAGNYLAFARGVWVPFVPPVAALALTYLSVSTLRYATTGRELRQTRSTLGRYMSPQLVEHVLETAELGGQKGDLSIMFSDVRNFTTLSEKSDPGELVELLNEYLEAMTEIVFKYEGVVDKFIGDGILAYWGAFTAKDKHAENACRAALEMLVKVEELNVGWRAQGKNGIAIGIGVNSGEVIFGNVGRGKKVEFTVIGDPVNLAARLESLNKVFSTNVVISEFTVARLGKLAKVRPLGGVKVKGKTVETAVFELLGVEEESARATTGV
jgi:adenylate cyclase